MPSHPRTHGQSRTTGSSQSPSSEQPTPNPLRVGHMIADSLEMAPSIQIPLEVRIGARRVEGSPNPSDGGTAMLNVHNTEDKHEYLILIIRK